ncbi:outer membrane protein [Fangia hongkongensis]|uniref:outer membrane protein n=1 Tax=Fangia hongkongensis TaxID=270495 RepID=UPI000364E222|nr:OmpW family outer membrane protein [Fangia hongkongensis]MBK2124490.1 outer membrane beta-barrel protein [Fangia hongkongensis]
MKKISGILLLNAIALGNCAFASGAQSGITFGVNTGIAIPSGWLKGDDLYNSYDQDPSIISASQKKNNITGGLSLGYDYAINNAISVGVEIATQYAYNITEVKGSSATDSMKNTLSVLSVPMFLTGKFFIPNTGGLNLFAKAGYAYNRVKDKSEYSTPFGDTNTSSYQNLWRPVVAGGVGYKLGSFNIFTQYQYNWLPLLGQSGGVSSITFGATYTLSVF